MRSAPANRTTLDLSLLLLRAALGVVFLFHGSQKLFGVFGGSGFQAFTRSVAAMGLRPPIAFAIFAACGEFLGGGMVLLGLAAEIGALAILGVVGVAVWKVTGRNGFSIAHQGFEYHALIIAACAVVVLCGPGRWAVWRIRKG